MGVRRPSGADLKALALLVAALVLVGCSVTVAGEPVAAPPTVAPAPAPVDPVAQSIASLLTQTRLVDRLPQVPGYERSCSPGDGCVFGQSWKDVERTGCDTRNRVLAAQLTDVVFKQGTQDCKVLSGTLVDPFTGATLQYGNGSTASIQVDHVFALARAWDAGAAAWPLERREVFANDLDNLLAVSGEENQSKSDSGPDTWLPPNPSFVCPYVEIYLKVAVEYGLSITVDDRDVAMNMCPG